ncbi:molybdopterin-dependent oxidoreductase [Candidatus Sumerlaeota bacterium]|nr:molybdopterin-dependent oxidoreductase [Candidatus Sumerlaeota bacterium]
MPSAEHLHFSHWGAFGVKVEDGAVVGVEPFALDPDPSRLIENVPGSLRHRARVTRPMIRAGWLERGPGPDSRRMTEPFVPVEWDTAIEIVAGELNRVYREHGAKAVYGGSY